MASATSKTELVERVVVTKVPATVVTLELDETEAAVIKFMVGRMSGVSAFRDVTSNIYNALTAANVDPNNALYNAQTRDNRYSCDTKLLTLGNYAP